MNIILILIENNGVININNICKYNEIIIIMS